MATLAVETTKRVLFEKGPYILQTNYFDHNLRGKKISLPRLQGPGGPHKTSNHDPHNEGRALDIILFASEMGERLTADQLVEVFLEVRETMKWSAVIYNNWEWNGAGKKFPRGGDAINRHVTHIHIEWTAASSANGAFEDELTDALEKRSWVLDPGF
jgi:hypothetical protein